MSYSLKYLPECYPRPAPLKTARWFMALVVMLAASVILLRIFGRYVDSLHFWLIALGIPTVLWIVGIAFRFCIWMLQDLKANGFDRRREKWILRETRRTRRALQVLNTTFVTAHSVTEQKDAATAMQSNHSIITSQADWEGNDGGRMSRFATELEETPELLITRLFYDLVADLPVSQFPDKTSLVVVFDFSSSLSVSTIRELWKEVWQRSDITCPVEYATGSGSSVIAHWLDHRIKESAMLLIISLQVAPASPDNTAEAAIALLLGNRLTQSSLEPIALLHRPDPALPGELEEGMRMAAYNVPLKENVVKNLWLAGLTSAQRTEVVECQNKHPAQSVEGENVVALDVSMGRAGAAAPWLAIAASAEIARQTQLPQMIINGDTTQDVLWSTLVTPIASRQEKDA